MSMSLCPCRPRNLFKLLLFSVLLLAVLCFLHPVYHSPLSSDHQKTQRNGQKERTKTRVDHHIVASEDEGEHKYDADAIHVPKTPHIAAVVIKASSEKQPNPPNDKEYEEENGEIDIPQELRDELWPTKPPHRSFHSINRATTTTESPSGPSKIYVDSIGQIGNQLFQFASVYGIAKSMKWEPVLNPRFLITALFSNITVASGEMAEDTRIYMEDGAGVYSPSLYQRRADSFGVCCFLQSWRYFHAYASDIRAQLQFHKEFISSAESILIKLTHEFIKNLEQEPKNDMFNDLPKLRKQAKDYFHSTAKKTSSGDPSTKGFHATLIGVHFHVSRKHRRKRNAGHKTPTLSQLRDYYERAMAYFRQRHHDALFVVVSDDQRWCRQNITTSYGDVMFAGKNAASVDLALLSLTKHTVIGAGAFGWWGGWLANGDVLYPDWIPPQNKLSSKDVVYRSRDFYPPWWLSVSVYNSTAN